MKKLLATFSYAGNFYELYVDKYGKTSVVVIGKNKHNVNNDEICKKVIDRINELRNEYFYSVDFKGEKVDVYFDGITDLFYFKKDGIRIKEEDSKYLDLYKMYNYLPEYSIYDDNGYNNFNFSYDDFERRSSMYSSYPDDDYFTADYNYKSNLKKQKKKKLKIIIGSVALSVSLLVGSFVAIPKIIKAKDNSDEINRVEITDTIEVTDTLDDPVIVYSKPSDLSPEEQIRESIIEYCGEQPEWVYEYAINIYNKDKKLDRLREALDSGASQEELDRIRDEIDAELATEEEEETNKEIDISLATERTNKLIEAINSNQNITDEEKNYLVNGLFTTFQKDAKYFEEERFEYVLELLSEFKIDRSYLENDAPFVLDNGFKAGGLYSAGSNVVHIYTAHGSMETLCHEVQHIIGGVRDYTFVFNKINEGMTESYSNVNLTYKTERLFYIIYEQIYGEDFFKKAFYNEKSMWSALEEIYGYPDYESHYDLFVEINDFLINCQQKELKELCEDPEYQNNINKYFDALMNEYNEFNGLDWHNNNILVACQKILTGKKFDLPDNLYVNDIIKGEDGNYYFQYSGEYTYHIDGSTITNFINDHEEIIR